MLKRSKRPFLLLEVLISFMLIVLCILPLLAPHVAIYKEQKQFINRIELNNRINLLYVDILEKMHKGEITLAEIINQSSFSYPVTPSLNAIYTFSLAKEKKRNKEGFNVHLAKLEILTQPIHGSASYTYEYLIFFASQLDASEEQNEEEDAEDA